MEALPENGSLAPAGPSLSIVIPTLGELQALQRCLASICEQELHETVEVLICMNGEGDLLWLSPESFQPKISLRILQTPSFSVYEARNQGMQESQGSIVYLMDDDCFLPRSRFLQELIDLHESRPEAVVLGGSFICAPGSTFWGRCYNLMTQLWVDSHRQDTGETICLPGGNISFKKNSVSSLTPFSKDLPNGGEEVDFLSRLRSKDGGVYYHPHLDSYHCSRHSWRSFLLRAMQHGRAKFRTRPHYEKDSSFRLRLSKLRSWNQIHFVMVLAYLTVMQISYLASFIKQTFLARLRTGEV